jgi:hypothetical protein
MGDRLERVLTALSSGDQTLPVTDRLCRVAADMTSMSGAWLVLFSDLQEPWLHSATDGVSDDLVDLEFTVGEGPCHDAAVLDQPVLEPDLANPTPPGRWPAFAPAAARTQARAVFGFPVHVGAARLGAIGLYRDRPGALSDDQHADSLVIADMSARAVLAQQAGASPGAVGADLASAASFQPVVHQATGMISVQLGIGVADALVRMRAYAFRADRPITDVAGAVVARQLRFDPGDQ